MAVGARAAFVAHFNIETVAVTMLDFFQERKRILTDATRSLMFHKLGKLASLLPNTSMARGSLV